MHPLLFCVGFTYDKINKKYKIFSNHVMELLCIVYVLITFIIIYILSKFLHYFRLPVTRAAALCPLNGGFETGGSCTSAIVVTDLTFMGCGVLRLVLKEGLN